MKKFEREELISILKLIYEKYGKLTEDIIRNFCTENKNMGKYFPAYSTFKTNFGGIDNMYKIIGKKNTNYLSFYDWCINNNHNDYINLWDEKLNNVNIKELHFQSNTKYYFKCERGLHESLLISPNKLVNGTKLRCKKCASIAQALIDKYGDDALNIYWNYELNDKSPWEISSCANYKIFINCKDVDYHIGAPVWPRHLIYNESICSFCNARPIHPLDTFGQFLLDKFGKDGIEKYWSNKNTISPFDIYKTSVAKVWIKCSECNYHNDYEIEAAHFYNGGRCSECSHANIVHPKDSIGSKIPKICDIWSDKNIKTPFEYSESSNKSVWFKCENNKHDDYYRSICNSVKYDFRCPECSNERGESIIQEIVRKYVEDKYSEYIVLHEKECTLKPINPKTGYPMRYDIEIYKLKTIIEVHGRQHYEICGFHNLEASVLGVTPEEIFEMNKERDEYKYNYAINHGYNYLIISYKDIYNSDNYMYIIDDYIESLLNSIKEAI